MAETESGTSRFREVQAFRQWWIRGSVLVLALLAWWAFLRQVVLGKPFGNRPAPDWTVWVLLVLFGVFLPLVFAVIRLVVTVDGEAVTIRFYPLRPRRIPLAEIRECEARTYRPLGEYGGWGIRWSPRRGMAYNVSGNRGVQLVLQSGKRVLIGSQRPEELSAAILSGRSSSPSSAASP